MTQPIVLVFVTTANLFLSLAILPHAVFMLPKFFILVKAELCFQQMKTCCCAHFVCTILVMLHQNPLTRLESMAKFQSSMQPWEFAYCRIWIKLLLHVKKWWSIIERNYPLRVSEHSVCKMD